MAELPRITLQQLVDLAATFPDEIHSEPSFRAFRLAGAVIRHFLGDEWLSRHVAPAGKKAAYFRRKDASDVDKAILSWRVVDLGELLLNLQDTPGFDDRTREMKTGDPEACVSELHIARALFINEWKFRFVPRSGQRGNDYDLEVTTAGNSPICIDAKCKIEATDLSAKTILNTLTSSSDQLPNDKPGVFFVKFPETWLGVSDYAQTMIGAAQDYFKPDKRRRIVSVILYAEPVSYSEGFLFTEHFYKEIPNPFHRFGTELDWRLLEKYNPPRWQENALPKIWRRFIYISKDGYHDPSEV